MGKSVYTRKAELFRSWTMMYNVNTIGMSFDEFQKFHEKEEKIYKHWLFYDKLLKRLEVASSGE